MTIVTGNADSFLACVSVREESASVTQGEHRTEWASALSGGCFAPRWRALSRYESHREGSARGRVHKVETRQQGGVPGEAGLGISIQRKEAQP